MDYSICTFSLLFVQKLKGNAFIFRYAVFLNFWITYIVHNCSLTIKARSSRLVFVGPRPTSTDSFWIAGIKRCGKCLLWQPWESWSFVWVWDAEPLRETYVWYQRAVLASSCLEPCIVSTGRDRWTIEWTSPAVGCLGCCLWLHMTCSRRSLRDAMFSILSRWADKRLRQVRVCQRRALFSPWTCSSCAWLAFSSNRMTLCLICRLAWVDLHCLRVNFRNYFYIIYFSFS